MHRLALFGLSLSAGLFAGCGGASNAYAPTPDHVIISAGSSGVATVSAGSVMALSAVEVHGAQNQIIYRNQFTWDGVVSNAGSYAYDSAGQTKPCGSVSSNSGGVTSAYAPDMSIYITIDPSSESNVLFSPPLVLAVSGGVPATIVYPYCVTINATTISANSATSTGDVTGSLTIAVTDPEDPLQFRLHAFEAGR